MGAGLTKAAGFLLKAEEKKPEFYSSFRLNGSECGLLGSSGLSCASVVVCWGCEDQSGHPRVLYAVVWLLGWTGRNGAERISGVCVCVFTWNNDLWGSV